MILYAVIAIILFILSIIFVPIGIIWAFNTLFALGIVYSISTWAAALLLFCLIVGVAQNRN